MFKKVNRSLEEILGKGYTDAAAEAAAFLQGVKKEDMLNIAKEKMDFYPESEMQKNEELMKRAGEQVITPFINDNDGASTEAYKKATSKKAAPLGGRGVMRLGEDGRLYFAAKSEHYHTPLGHNFPGYKLIENAKKLGIPNATHNNTRGYITRLAEKTLISDVNGGIKGEELEKALLSKETKVLNRVINLQTGSLSVEAGIKMMLSRFYKLDKTYKSPEFSGKTPVFLVMEDNDGGFEANYHGTTVIAQTLRGMWPEFYKKAENAGLYRIVSVKKNDLEDFKRKIEQFNTGEYRTAGFLHEIILMNYGGIRLTEEFLQGAYTLCEKYKTPTLVDEIQSCMWYNEMFLFRLYGLKPDFVIIGKGFPGGEYTASKIITTFEMDSLNQFGALVTNGQEELASLAYLITMEFVRNNGEELIRLGNMFENRLRSLKDEFPSLVVKIEGKGLLSAIHFSNVAGAVEFASILNSQCIDVSAQTYKANCPPAALVKPPVITGEFGLEYLYLKFKEALKKMGGSL